MLEVTCPNCRHEFVPSASRVDAVDDDESGPNVHATIWMGLTPYPVDFRLSPVEMREDPKGGRQIERPKRWTAWEIEAEVNRRLEERLAKLQPEEGALDPAAIP